MRGFTTALVLLLAGDVAHGSGPGDGIEDAGQLSGTIEALQAPLKSLYCEYEGERLEQDTDTKTWHEYRLYSGMFHYKVGEKYLNEVFLDHLPNKRAPTRKVSTQSVLLTESGTQIYSRADGSAGRVQARHTGLFDLVFTGGYGSIFLLPSFKALLKYGPKRLVHEGSEVIAGATCERYAIVLGQEPYAAEASLVERFWIDLARGGNVLRFETVNRGMLLSTTQEIELERFEVPGGVVWLPSRGRVVTAVIEGGIPAQERYGLIKGSVVLNREVPDRRFTVKYPMGTPVTDQVKKLFYELGQDTRPAPTDTKDAQARLDEALAEAEKVRDELDASAWSRGPGVNWVFWLPLSLSVAAAGGAGVLVLRRLGGSR